MARARETLLSVFDVFIRYEHDVVQENDDNCFRPFPVICNAFSVRFGRPMLAHSCINQRSCYNHVTAHTQCVVIYTMPQ